jgi:hypothetical protein
MKKNFTTKAHSIRDAGKLVVISLLGVSVLLTLFYAGFYLVCGIGWVFFNDSGALPSPAIAALDLVKIPAEVLLSIWGITSGMYLFLSWAWITLK